MNFEQRRPYLDSGCRARKICNQKGSK